ncbi:MULTISPECIES: hypothetical protein [Kocuria]|uniref:hypothetical protein n=1 Tax=Kocuria TaxID=57493 RepID=UPI000661269A|nr:MULTISPECIES: hypothetical protein [Kocuria]MCT1368177.1 hypothetical protein [Rothia sp. p3-SID1597]RUQ23257.1 hypothetical protein D8M21_00620 [Kocuria sp. HSID16901]
MAFSLSNAALRAIPGAFIINSGLGKLNLDEQTAGYLQSMAGKAFPAVKDLDAATFGKALAYSELAVGGALVAPFIPTRLAGLALGAFSGGMLTMYFKTEEFTQEDGIRPTQDGTAIAKDSWLAAIALALLVQTKGKKKSKKK